VLRLVRAERDAGRSIASVARRLGICRGTLALWLAAERKVGKAPFRAVEIVRETPKTSESGEEGRRFVVRTRLGVSVEGLSLDDVSEILRRLA
jgi:transposase-like protein